MPSLPGAPESWIPESSLSVETEPFNEAAGQHTSQRCSCGKCCAISYAKRMCLVLGISIYTWQPHHRRLNQSNERNHPMIPSWRNCAHMTPFHRRTHPVQDQGVTDVLSAKLLEVITHFSDIEAAFTIRSILCPINVVERDERNSSLKLSPPGVCS